ncbi:hypothetical protein V8E36_006571 [Tilletia maclaganii]
MLEETRGTNDTDDPPADGSHNLAEEGGQEDLTKVDETSYEDNTLDPTGRVDSARSSFDVSFGYPVAMYEDAMDVRPEESIRVHIDGIWKYGQHVGTDVLVQPNDAVGVLSQFLFKEFGFSLEFQHNGVELDPTSTFLENRFFGFVDLTAVYLPVSAVAATLSRPVMPIHINALTLWFAVHKNNNDTDRTVEQFVTIVPCGATLKSIWERDFVGYDFNFNPRFFYEGERLNITDVVARLDLSEGVLIQVFPMQEGGGPQGGNLLEGDEGAVGPTIKPKDEPLVDTSEPPRTHPTYYVSGEDTVFLSPGVESLNTSTIGSGTRPFRQSFNGNRVEDFFEEYELKCRNLRIPPEEWFDHLRSRLSSEEPHDLRSFAEYLPEWATRSYEGVKSQLLEQFATDDEDKYALEDLKSFVSKDRTIKNKVQLNKYLIDYKVIANVLLRHDRITQKTMVDWFLEGLPQAVRDELEKRDFETRKSNTRGISGKVPQLTFKQVETDVKTLFTPTTYYASFNHNRRQEQDRVQHPEKVKTPGLSMEGPKSAKKQKDEQMKRMEDLVATMSINVSTLVNHGTRMAAANNTRASAATYASTHNAAQTSGSSAPPATTIYQGDPARQSTSTPPQRSAQPPSNAPTGPSAFNSRSCYYCGEPGHGMRGCPVKANHLHDGIMTEGADGKIRSADGNLLPWVPGQMHSLAQQRFDAWRRSSRTVSSNTHRFEYIPDDWTDDEHEFMPLGEEPVARTNLQHFQCSTNELFGDIVADAFNAEKRKLDEPAGTEANKRLRTGEVEVTKKMPEQAEQGTDEMEADEEEAADTSSKKGKRRGPPQNWILSPAQERFSSLKTYEKIMSQMISLPLEEILAMNPDLRKLMVTDLKGRKVARIGPQPEPHVHFTGLGTAYYTHSLLVIEMLCPTLPGRILRALVDTGSEINMVDPSVVEEARLPVRTDGKHRVVGINGRPELLEGLVEGFRLTLGGVEAQLHTWLRKGLGYDLLIGMPGIIEWEMDIRMTGNKQHIEVRGADGVRVKIGALRAKDPRNRQYLPPNLGRTKLVPAPDSGSDSE